MRRSVIRPRAAARRTRCESLRSLRSLAVCSWPPPAGAAGRVPPLHQPRLRLPRARQVLTIPPRRRLPRALRVRRHPARARRSRAPGEAAVPGRHPRASIPATPSSRSPVPRRPSASQWMPVREAAAPPGTPSPKWEVLVGARSDQCGLQPRFAHPARCRASVPPWTTPATPSRPTDRRGRPTSASTRTRSRRCMRLPVLLAGGGQQRRGRDLEREAWSKVEPIDASPGAARRGVMRVGKGLHGCGRHRREHFQRFNVVACARPRLGLERTRRGRLPVGIVLRCGDHQRQRQHLQRDVVVDQDGGRSRRSRRGDVRVDLVLLASVAAATGSSPITGAQGRLPTSVVAGAGPQSVSCPTASFCMAIDGATNTLSWHP